MSNVVTYQRFSQSTEVMIRLTEMYWHIVLCDILIFLLLETLGHFYTVILFQFFNKLTTKLNDLKQYFKIQSRQF